MNQATAQKAASGKEDHSGGRRATFSEAGAPDPGLDPQLEVQRSVVEDQRWDFDAAIKAGEWSILLDSLESGFGADEEDNTDAEGSVLTSILDR